MPLLPRKHHPKLSDIAGQLPPQHDRPCKRIAYSDSKALFVMLLTECKDG